MSDSNTHSAGPGGVDTSAWDERLIFERSRPGRRCVTYPKPSRTVDLPESMRREAPPALPEVDEEIYTVDIEV